MYLFGKDALCLMEGLCHENNAYDWLRVFVDLLSHLHSKPYVGKPTVTLSLSIGNHRLGRSVWVLRNGEPSVDDTSLL